MEFHDWMGNIFGMSVNVTILHREEFPCFKLMKDIRKDWKNKSAMCIWNFVKNMLSTAK